MIEIFCRIWEIWYDSVTFIIAKVVLPAKGGFWQQSLLSETALLPDVSDLTILSSGKWTNRAKWFWFTAHRIHSIEVHSNRWYIVGSKMSGLSHWCVVNGSREIWLSAKVAYQKFSESSPEELLTSKIDSARARFIGKDWNHLESKTIHWKQLKYHPIQWEDPWLCAIDLEQRRAMADLI
jgi:hypothetical protein